MSTNKADLKSLISAEWRDRTADAMVQAVDTFFTTRLAGRAAKIEAECGQMASVST